MNSQPTQLASRCILIAAAVLLGLVTPVLAQTGPPEDRTNQERLRQQDMSRREYQLRNLGVTPNRPSDDKQIKAVVAQIEQDFSRILILHNKIARATSSDQALDHSFISDVAAEIKKRASRLQTTLALREPTNHQQSAEKPIEFDDEGLKATLRVLCKQIKSFVTNPVIESPGTVNLVELANARRDLESIIELSDQIKKNLRN